MKLSELSSAAPAAEVDRRLFRVIAIVLWLGLFLGSYNVCVSQELQELLPNPEKEQGLPEDCRPLLKDAPISGITVDIRPRDLEGEIVPEAKLPTDCNKYLDVPVRNAALGFPPATPVAILRCWGGVAFCHHPLYFEDVCLERYGASHGFFQSAISTAHFFGGAVLLPVKMLFRPPHHCVCTPRCF